MRSAGVGSIPAPVLLDFRTMRGFVTWLGLALLAVAPGLAAAVDEVEEEPQRPTSTSVRVVGFVDRGGDCDPVLAAAGDCVELVDFASPVSAFTSRDASSTQLAQWRTYGVLYAQLWEDLAYRWSRTGDVLTPTLIAHGATQLPPSSLLWEASTRERGRIYSLPGPEVWLTRDHWIANGGDRGAGFFRQVRYTTPEGQKARPAVVLLSGRFALRLGFSGRRHDYDLMNGDPERSGPFFEQMYPFSTAMESGNWDLVPLSHFGGFEVDPFRGFEIRGYRGIRAVAGQEFYNFSRLLGTQLAQYGLEDYTTNHMRVLTALTAMQSPPGSLEQRTGRAGDLVAAALGETDSAEEVEKRLHAGAYRLDHTLEINYYELPPELVVEYVRELTARAVPGDRFFSTLNRSLATELEDLLRTDPTLLQDLDDASIQAWVVANVRPGIALDVVADHTRRALLRMLVGELDEAEQDEMETRLLLDHVNLEVSSTFDTRDDARAAPQALAEATSKRWEAVLAKHGYLTHHFSQGLGAVDPTSICTTLDGADALSEEVFGAVTLDLLFRGAAAPTDPETLLWEARDQLPFLMVDGPWVTAPQVERLVGLPGDYALYRARWELWSGWHLFWTAEPVGEDDDRVRPLVRTGAVCDDTVLAPPDLVATVVRAGLLDGDFRPAIPVRGPKWKIQAPDVAAMSEDELVDGAVSGIGQGADAVEGAEAAADNAATGPDGLATQLELKGTALDALIAGDAAVGEEVVTETTQYVRDVVREPLLALAEESPTVLVVFDSVPMRQIQPLRDRWPRTPYAHHQALIHKRTKREGKQLRTASWGHFVRGGEEPLFALITPAYRPTESVGAGSLTPRWRRNRTHEWNLHFALGFNPIWYSRNLCGTPDEMGHPGAPCMPTTSYGEGLSIDLGVLSTWWLVDDHRFALALGPHVQLDVTPGGTSPLWYGEDDRMRRWAFRGQAGFMVGLRAAPDPAPLVLTGRGTPWGAENAEGVSRAARVHLGFRTGFMLGPGEEGTELSVPLELWLAGSLRRARSPHASFTPYQPGMLLGPYLRLQLEFVTAFEEVKFRTTHRGFAVIAGVRAHIRLKKKFESLPDEGVN